MEIGTVLTYVCSRNEMTGKGFRSLYAIITTETDCNSYKCTTHTLTHPDTDQLQSSTAQLQPESKTRARNHRGGPVPAYLGVSMLSSNKFVSLWGALNKTLKNMYFCTSSSILRFNFNTSGFHQIRSDLSARNIGLP